MDELIIIRHGDALPGPVDHERRLSPTGRERVAALAAALRSRGVRVDEIRHSGLVRARETAELIAEGLAARPRVAEAPNLGSGDDPETMVAELGDLRGAIAIVSHVPFVRRLSALLIEGDSGGSCLAFGTATAACLVPNSDGRWSVAWIESPA